MKKPLLKLTSAILSATMLLSSVALFSSTATAVTESPEATTSSSNFFDKLPAFSTGDNSLKEETSKDVKSYFFCRRLLQHSNFKWSRLKNKCRFRLSSCKCRP